MLQGLGADDVLDYTKDTVDKAYLDNPFDVIVDHVGGNTQHDDTCLHVILCVIASQWLLSTRHGHHCTCHFS